MKIQGNTQNVKDVILQKLEELYDTTVPFGMIVSPEIVGVIGSISAALNKEISLYVSRNGTISNIAIGSNTFIELPKMEGRRGRKRLCGYRCIHTHPSGDSALSAIDLNTLQELHLDAMVALGYKPDNPEASELSFAMITDIDDNDECTVEAYGPLNIGEALMFNFNNSVATLERLLNKGSSSISLADRKEKAVLISMVWGRETGLWTQEDSLEELKQLADTAGAEVVAKLMQKRPKPDPVFFIGKGKVEELSHVISQGDVDLVVFDDDLSPAQQRNLERALGVRVIDRTGLILDIFAQRARTSEGKMQVELAQLQYRLPRVMGQGLFLSRLGGGIGTRGPGETKLEIDRRKIRDRIAFIKKQIEKLGSVRETHNRTRIKRGVPQVSLVGYTNAGKSTLLNTLTDSDIYVEDQLFATLDPTTRQLDLGNKTECILTDTVGFIQRLPHQLVAAFKSTLEDTVNADLLLHVVDVSHVLYKEQMAAVYSVLEELGVSDKPILTVYNKIDKLGEENALATRLAQEENAVCISAKKGINLDGLKEKIIDNLNLKLQELKLLFPYAEAGQAAKLHQVCTVLNEEYGEAGIKVKVALPRELLSRYEKYICEE